MATLYCAPSDIRDALGGTDQGTGTAAALTDHQLTQAITIASNEVSAYSGTTWDSSSDQAIPPPLVIDLTIGMACFYATGTYLKGKTIPQDDPVRVRYTRAVQILSDVRDGKVRLDPGPPGQIRERGNVINRIHPVFTGRDANVQLGRQGYIEPLGTPEWFKPGWTEEG